jgi:hypothetical protein
MSKLIRRAKYGQKWKKRLNKDWLENFDINIMYKTGPMHQNKAVIWNFNYIE